MDSNSTAFVIRRLPQQTDTFLIVFNLLLGLMAASGSATNIAVILKITTTKALRTVPNMLSVMLSSNFLVQSAIDLPLKVYLNSLKEGDTITKSFCQHTVWLQLLIDSSCAVVMALIALNKWAAVTKDPLFYLKLFSPRRAGLLVFIALMLINGFGFLYLVSANSYLAFDEVLLFCFLRPHMEDVIPSFSFSIIIIIYTTLIAASVFSYSSIGWHFRETRRKIQSTRTVRVNSGTTNVNNRSRAKKQKVYALCALHAVSLLTWLPFIGLMIVHFDSTAAIPCFSVVTTHVLSISKIVLFPTLTLHFLTK